MNNREQATEALQSARHAATQLAEHAARLQQFLCAAEERFAEGVTPLMLGAACHEMHQASRMLEAIAEQTKIAMHAAGVEKPGRYA